jgi:hypothetical protein
MMWRAHCCGRRVGEEAVEEEFKLEGHQLGVISVDASAAGNGAASLAPSLHLCGQCVVCWRGRRRRGSLRSCVCGVGVVCAVVAAAVLVSSSMDCNMRVWNAETGKVDKIIDAGPGALACRWLAWPRRSHCQSSLVCACARAVVQWRRGRCRTTRRCRKSPLARRAAT